VHLTSGCDATRSVVMAGSHTVQLVGDLKVQGVDVAASPTLLAREPGIVRAVSTGIEDNNQ
jgi:hypothetical protein